MVRYALAFIFPFMFASCAAAPKSEERSPANDGRLAIRQSGESCRLNLDGDTRLDKVVIKLVDGKRMADITLTSGAPSHREELSSLQFVKCVSNQEPGVPVRGTDETEKAVSIPLMNDYLRVEKEESSAKLVYFDPNSKTYRAIFQAD